MNPGVTNHQFNELHTTNEVNISPMSTEHFSRTLGLPFPIQRTIFFFHLKFAASGFNRISKQIPTHLSESFLGFWNAVNKSSNLATISEHHPVADTVLGISKINDTDVCTRKAEASDYVVNHVTDVVQVLDEKSFNEEGDVGFVENCKTEITQRHRKQCINRCNCVCKQR